MLREEISPDSSPMTDTTAAVTSTAQITRISHYRHLRMVSAEGDESVVLLKQTEHYTYDYAYRSAGHTNKHSLIEEDPADHA